MAQPKIEGTGHGKPRMIYGSDGEHWYAIRVDNDGRPHVVVEVNALPTGAATQATLALCLAELEDIVKHANLQIDATTKAVAVCSDEGDKIFSFESRVLGHDDITLASGSEVALCSPVDANRVWVITHVAVRNYTRAATSFLGGIKSGATSYYLLNDSDGAARYVFSPFICHLYLAAGEQLFFIIGGGENGDAIDIDYNGYQMNEP